MGTRLWKVALLLLVGLGGLVRPPSAPAQALSFPDEDACNAQKRQEVKDMQVLGAYIAGSALGVALLVIYFLNSANKREKKLSERFKQKRVLDPDAPLPYEPSSAEPPPHP